MSEPEFRHETYINGRLDRVEFLKMPEAPLSDLLDYVDAWGATMEPKISRNDFKRTAPDELLLDDFTDDAASWRLPTYDWLEHPLLVKCDEQDGTVQIACPCGEKQICSWEGYRDLRTVTFCFTCPSCKAETVWHKNGCNIPSTHDGDCQGNL